MSVAVPTKCCSKCGKDLPLTDFHRRRHHVKAGVRAACKGCTAKDTKDRRKGRTLSAEEKLKKIVRQRTSRAILRGELVPQPCRDCGSHEVQAHHPDYVAPDAHLHVVWLCVDDHHREHGDSDWCRQLDMFPGAERETKIDPRVIHRVPA
ncbi:MAG: hypothetical protein RMA76_09295 [Deltaproteobacteria bacterium]|jgi:hypothetical protein